jgi:glyoxylase-like metal-dependent hydrolase (beta-lactamase superfamily II)
MTMDAKIRAFFDDETNTISYLVQDPQSRHALVIDPVLDFDPKSGRTATRSADRVLNAARADGLSIDWVLETHAHADHLSAAPYFLATAGARVAIGEHIRDVQRVFAPIFDATDITGDGRPFDRLLKDGEVLQVGGLAVEVMHTPGHTPACVSYRIGDDVFVGDTLFMPDYGTARADFPGGDARALYRSIRRLLSLPSHTRLWLCHDYKPPGRNEHAWQTTVGEERVANVQVHDGVSEDEFVAARTGRDKTLPMPVLLLPSVQVNIRAGHLPPPGSNGQIYLKLPVNRL